jgi:mycoredoxin
MADIKMYGTTWCPDCFRAKQIFERLKIPYAWIDIEKDAAALDFVRGVNHGMHSVPTIVFPDGSILVEPGSKELENKLKEIK